MTYYDAATSPTLVTKQDGSGLWLVVAGTDTDIYIAGYDRASDEWKDFQKVIGPSSDCIAAAMIGTQLWLVRRNIADNGVYYGYLTNPADPSTFSGWAQIPGTATSLPPAAAAYNGLLYLMHVGGGGAMFWGSLNPGTLIFSGWTNIAGATTRPVACTGMNGHLYVAHIGGGNQVFYGSVGLSDNSFSGWTEFASATSYGPTLTTDGTNMDLFHVGTSNGFYSIWGGANFGAWVEILNSPAKDDMLGAALITYSTILEKHVAVRVGTALWHVIIKNSDGSVIRAWKQITERTQMVMTDGMTFLISRVWRIVCMAWSENQPSIVKSQIPCVAICVPHFGSVSMEWVESTWGPLRYIPQSDFAKTPRLSRGILNLDTHRNELVKSALADKAVTHILFLDTDVVAESPSDINQAVRMLLQCNAPIASGLYRAKKQKGEYPYAMWAKNPTGGIGYTSIESWSGNWLQVAVIGFGFVLIERRVWETVPAPWFVWKDATPSEDFYACELFAKYGFETRVLTDVQLSHLGSLKVLCKDAKVTSMEV